MERFLPAVCDKFYLRKGPQGAHTGLSVSLPADVCGEVFLEIIEKAVLV